MPGSATALRGNNLFNQTLYIASVAVPATVTAATTTNSTLTVKGIRLGDVIGWNMQTTSAGLAVTGMFVSAIDTITIQWSNVTIADIDGAGPFAFLLTVTRPENAVDGGITTLPPSVT